MFTTEALIKSIRNAIAKGTPTKKEVSTEDKYEKYGWGEKEELTMNVSANNADMNASRDCYLDMQVGDKTEIYLTGELCQEKKR